MMDRVHSRRNDDQVQNPFEFNRQSPVGMMKECRGFECDEEHDQHYRADAEKHHSKRKKSDRKNHFAEMESRGGAHIEVEICMMYVMESPEERDHVIGPLPPPVSVIHQQKRGDASGPSGHSDPVQQTDMSISRPHRYPDRDRQHGETDDRETGN